jgi:hypothetical protein
MPAGGFCKAIYQKYQQKAGCRQDKVRQKRFAVRLWYLLIGLAQCLLD